jgi:hypothetical protein
MPELKQVAPPDMRERLARGVTPEVLEARKILVNLVREVGGGFHPDTSFEFYIHFGKGRRRVYSNAEAKKKNALLSFCFTHLGGDVYEIALEEMERLYPVPREGGAR